MTMKNTMKNDYEALKKLQNQSESFEGNYMVWLH